MMASSLRARSSALTSRISTPSLAPRPEPTISAVGVARPSAHGHATTSTAIIGKNPLSQSRCERPHAMNVSAAITMTAGTKIEEMRSAKR